MPAAVTHTVPLTATVARLIDADRHAGHTHVMAAFPDGLGKSPRHAVGALWHIDTETQRLTVRHHAHAPQRDLLGATSIPDEPLPTTQAGEKLSVSVAIACQKTPPSDVPVELRPLLKAQTAYRSKLVTVPEAERRDWFIRRFAAIGFAVDPDSIEITPLRKANLGRQKGSIPFVEIYCTGTVSDESLFNTALASGIGKGKNYGLGLIRLNQSVHA